MDQTAPRLTVVYSPAASEELQDIWDYNLEFYQSAEHATRYVEFLYEEMENLSSGYLDGRQVSTRPELRFITLKWSRDGHGHIAVYEIDLDAATVTVAHVFHTRQNWEVKLKRERRKR